MKRLQLLTRVDPELRDAVSKTAGDEGISLNDLVVKALKNYLGIPNDKSDNTIDNVSAITTLAERITALESSAVTVDNSTAITTAIDDRFLALESQIQAIREELGTIVEARDLGGRGHKKVEGEPLLIAKETLGANLPQGFLEKPPVSPPVISQQLTEALANNGIEIEPVPTEALANNGIKIEAIEQLQLSQRTYNSLKRAQINSIADLLKYSEEEMLLYPNFGQKSLEDVNKALLNLGYTLQETPIELTEALGVLAAIVESIDPPKTLADIPIEKLKIGKKIWQCLKCAGIHSVADLMGKRERGKLLKFKNFSQKSAEEVIKAIRQMGIALQKSGG